MKLKDSGAHFINQLDGAYSLPQPTVTRLGNAARALHAPARSNSACAPATSSRSIVILLILLTAICAMPFSTTNDDATAVSPRIITSQPAVATAPAVTQATEPHAAVRTRRTVTANTHLSALSANPFVSAQNAENSRPALPKASALTPSATALVPEPEASAASAAESIATAGAGNAKIDSPAIPVTALVNVSAAPEAAPAQVDSAELTAILAAYHSRIVELIKAQKQYPQIARRMGHQGIVRLSFTLSSNGSLVSSAVNRSSDFAELDGAALNSLRAVNRFPAFPTQLGAEPRAFMVSLNFTID